MLTRRLHLRPSRLLLLVCLALGSAGCPGPRPGGDASGRVAPEEFDADVEGGPQAEALLGLERGLVLWFSASTPGVEASPREAAFFAARDERGALFLESLGLGGQPPLRLRLATSRGGIWVYPVGAGPTNAASEIYHPARAPGRDAPLEGAPKARRVSHSEGGAELALWLVPGEGLWRLELSLEGALQLRLERIRRTRWGSRPAPYPAETPAEAWESVARALNTLDVVGLRQLMTPKLWARLLPPGEGLALPPQALDQERRLALIRVIVPQLLEARAELTGPFELEGEQARAPAELRVATPTGLEARPARVELSCALTQGAPRWSWADCALKGE